MRIRAPWDADLWRPDATYGRLAKRFDLPREIEPPDAALDWALRIGMEVVLAVEKNARKLPATFRPPRVVWVRSRPGSRPGKVVAGTCYTVEGEPPLIALSEDLALYDGYEPFETCLHELAHAYDDAAAASEAACSAFADRYLLYAMRGVNRILEDELSKAELHSQPVVVVSRSVRAGCVVPGAVMR